MDLMLTTLRDEVVGLGQRVLDLENAWRDFAARIETLENKFTPPTEPVVQHPAADGSVDYESRSLSEAGGAALAQPQGPETRAQYEARTLAAARAGMYT